VRNEPNFEVSSFQFEVASVRPERAYAPCSDFKPQTSHFKLPARHPRGRGCVRNEPNLAAGGPGSGIGRRWPGAGPGGQMRKTNPISPGGVGGGLPCPRPSGLAPPPKVIMQNEPNFARAPGNGRGPAGRGARPKSDCAKRTQFRPGAGVSRRESCRTKPNLGGLGYVGKGGCRVGCGSAGE
jgi:hypothetical protein